MQDSLSLAKKFEFPGSKKYYPESIGFSIDYMILDIEPNFELKTLTNCYQEIDITAKRDIDYLEFDIAEIRIDRVELYDLNENQGKKPILQPPIDKEKPDKIRINLPNEKRILRGQRIKLKIQYSCGSIDNSTPQKPRSGFHFIEDKEGKAYQAWTQGETIESKYWFPCVDHPQLKYKREIRVTAPNNFLVISNGEKIDNKDNKWIWKEHTLNPAYLTSVVIGEFQSEYEKYRSIDLNYYWPKLIPKDDAMRTFKKTPQIMNFFESLLDTEYPYKKYSQIAVDKFEFAGMENTNATTLNENLFHDKTASIDFDEDIIVVVHELAHQWFGDLVTLEDWQDTWLNEGFANYCEALYLDKEYIFNPNSTDSFIRNEFFYKTFLSVQAYLREAINVYQRPIVTNTYKHPDDLFDTSHSYAKAGFILHMLRSMINDDNKFRKCLKTYLGEHKFKNAETDNVRLVFEKETGLNLLQFFDQWLYRAGHPEIEIEFSINESNNFIIKLKQPKDTDPFVFNLEIKIVYRSGKEEKKIVEVTEKEQSNIFVIPEKEEIFWFSIDPELKILKYIKEMRIPNESSSFQIRELLKRQLKYGKTIIERIDAANQLSKHYSNDVVDMLEGQLKSEPFYGVTETIVNTIGSFKDNSDIQKTRNAYEKLKVILDDESTFSNLHPKVKRALVTNIGNFNEKDSINSLWRILNDNYESYFVRSSAATAIAKSIIKNQNKEEKLDIITKLENKIDHLESFRQVIAEGAINGLREFYKDPDEKIIIRVGTFLLKKSEDTNNYYIRIAAINALRKFVNTKNHKLNDDIKNLNDEVFSQLIDILDISLINDTRRRIKTTAASSLVDPDALEAVPDQRIFQTINTLASVVQYDVDGFVRKSVERNLYVVRDYLTKWISEPPEIKFTRKKKKIEIPHIELPQSEKYRYEKILELTIPSDLPIC